jgi:hypothetical protein
MVLLDRYNWIWLIFNFKIVFIFKFLNLFAQPAFHVGAHPSGRQCVLPGPQPHKERSHLHRKTTAPRQYVAMSSSCGPLYPAGALLPSTRLLLSSSCGPLRPARANEQQLLRSTVFY